MPITQSVPQPGTTRAAVSADDLPALAIGCSVLGTGGGGAVDGALSAASAALDAHGPVRLVRPADLPDDALVVAMSMIGAPTVGQEMLPSAGQAGRVLDAVAGVYGRRPDAVMAAEIGGRNGVSPVTWAAANDLALLDADAMGRAFPEGQMTSFTIAGLRPEVVVLVDVLGNSAVLRPVDAAWAERHARALCVASGASAMLADHVLTAAAARDTVIPGSVSRAVAIGRAVLDADVPLAGLRAELGARELIEGKVVDVERRTEHGFVRGAILVQGTGAAKGRMLRLEIQNENLVALEDGRVLASVPDLITVVDTQTAATVFTELVRYGQRVSVLAWPCHPLWRTDRGLRLAGPRVFGYELDYRPVEELAVAHEAGVSA